MEEMQNQFQAPVEAKKKFYKKWWFWVIVVVLFVGAIGALNDKNNSGSDGATNGTTSAAETTVSTQTETTTQGTTAPNVKTYSKGMYKIGTDMPAGEYVIIANSAYFQISSDSTGELGSIIANDNFTNRAIVTVADGQYFEFKSGTAYAIDDAPTVDTSGTVLPPGTYKVGKDLPAGEYKIRATGYGYVEVGSKSDHVLDSIVSNDNFTGEKYITVKDGQYLKFSNAELILK